MAGRASYFGTRGSFRASKPREDVDPMTSMSNVGDIMLVFACGLMCALVVAWNIKLGDVTEVEMDEELDPNSVEAITEQLYGEGNAFIEQGTVYQDPQTGQWYLVQKDGTTSDANVSGDSNASGGSENAGQ